MDHLNIYILLVRNSNKNPDDSRYLSLDSIKLNELIKIFILFVLLFCVKILIFCSSPIFSAFFGIVIKNSI